MCRRRVRVGRDAADWAREAAAAAASGAPAIESEERHPLACLNWPAVVLIRAYQVTLSPWLGRSCRFYPTCSNYGLAAFRHHHALRASVLTVWRVCRCHPGRRGGYEPVVGVRRRGTDRTPT